MAVAVSAACSDSSAGEDGSRICEPGETQACLGPSSCSGVQICEGDGQRWGSCDCGAGGSGGGSGSGGSGASGGSGGSADASVGGAPNDAATDSSADATIDGPDLNKLYCPQNLPGPQMIAIPAPQGGYYCIDSIETSLLEYDAFMKSTPSLAKQPTVCAWNDSWELHAHGTPLTKFTVAKYGKSAVRGVDWCDAYAYCAWAGKRLCGKIGGGSVAKGQHANAKESEWYNACSQGGKSKYPWEGFGGGCLADPYFSPKPNTKYQTPDCEGGYPGLFAMYGNLGEWMGTCESETGKNDKCWIRSWKGECAAFENKWPRYFAAPEVGIRCCADAKGTP